MLFEAATDEDGFENRVSLFEVMLRFVEKVRVGVAEAMETELNRV